jgi:para-nitrobenzyl esterase
MKPVLALALLSLSAFPANTVKTANGALEGTSNPATGIRMFKGIPFAQPPVGDLRWKAPQPPKNWTGVRKAAQFGPRCAQRPVFSDMNFRSNGMGEDCLYLNVWTPAKSASAKLPVLVYFYGGGFIGGDGSEPRYDGERLATMNIVTVTLNYRLDIFGFLVHPELTQESPHHASGNYGLLDQNAALLWVKRNIAAFGGDPNRLTIAGESAGSFSVSAQMASPLSKDLIAGAIGESGSLLGGRAPSTLPEAEKAGTKFAASVGANSLAALRAMSVEQLFKEVGKPGAARFAAVTDGYFFPQPPKQIYAEGRQAHVPLLVGWNSAESPGGVLGKAAPTPENFANAVRKLYPHQAGQALTVYAASTAAEVAEASIALAGDRFIAHSTWVWSNLCEKTGGKPVFRYYFTRPRPAQSGAVHSAEIEYALGNLATNKVYAWTEDDYKVSRTMEGYFANFIKTGNPNGAKLPAWPAANSAPTVPVMTLDVNSQANPEKHRARYEFHDSLVAQSPADEAAIREVVKSYVDARERIDPKATEALFTSDADQLVSSGEWRKGLDAVVKGTTASSQNNSGKRTITVESIRFLAADIAIADGRYELIGAESNTRKMWTTLILKRSAGNWKITAIRNMLPATGR